MTQRTGSSAFVVVGILMVVAAVTGSAEGGALDGRTSQVEVTDPSGEAGGPGGRDHGRLEPYLIPSTMKRSLSRRT